MQLYDRVKDLPLDIDSYELTHHEQNCTGDFARASVVLSIQDHAPDTPEFRRPCTQIALRGQESIGYGEDVTYDKVDHQALLESSSELPLAGKYTIASFSAALDRIDLFPNREPEREASRYYRRWALESAALDLALKQARMDLATVLDREYDPVRFVVSNRLGNPPTFDRVATWLELNPNLEFKLDIDSGWTGTLIGQLAEIDAVQVLDFKGRYKGTMVDQPSNADLYRRLIENFPDVLIEDPVLTDETQALFEGIEHRITWDAPITGVRSIEQLPFEPDWLNIKPSRFGTLESLFNSIEYCLNHDIQMYGGGQTELGVGRQHIHALASLFYPSSPNDIAPRPYNHPEPTSGLPTSPLSPPADPRGFEWH
ncbi:enolase-like domain-containing protein [Halococcus sediminicola]|uniref:enolase n=1 Tax=Halococcus sediminicola TaxID=1264579 RepID=UPI0006787583|nr:enolase [Halococcus sediminicola]